MGKVVQRNWLLIITGTLFLLAILYLLISINEQTDINRCTYGGVNYKRGDVVTNYSLNNRCVCKGSNNIVCDNADSSISYVSFVNTDLLFSYSFVNFLNTSIPDVTRIIPVDVNHLPESLEISFERESMCGENNMAPSQVGSYKLSDNSLILTTLTNADPGTYVKTCLISNTFRIGKKDLNFSDDYSVMYQNEKGQLFDLTVCSYMGKLYAPGDSFKKGQENKVCSCDLGSVICK